MVEEDEGDLDSDEELEMGQEASSDSDEDASQQSQSSKQGKKQDEEETKSRGKPSIMSSHGGSQTDDHFLEDVFELYGTELDISMEDFDGMDKSTFKK